MQHDSALVRRLALSRRAALDDGQPQSPTSVGLTVCLVSGTLGLALIAITMVFTPSVWGIEAYSFDRFAPLSFLVVSGTYAASEIRRLVRSH